eukprot:snap_masked-scaffold_14-processed-gene-5.39-mRNA-1 protein AED:1.00 eAED:1.00 QI:0/-1/0/0/-1/1/1/0/89
MKKETRVDIVVGLKMFGLHKAEVSTTDGSKAIEKAAGEFGATCVLCRKHFLLMLNTAKYSLKALEGLKLTSNRRQELVLHKLPESRLEI